MIIKEFRSWDTPKIKSTVIKLKSTILENKFKLSQGELADVSVIRQSKKVIAQLLTILREREDKLTFKDWKQYGEMMNKKEDAN